LFEGTAAETDRLDALIESHAEHWRVGRMSVIDRAILRLAVYELTRTSTPPKVILDEAIELAKKFSGDEAAPFVNGVLDAIARSLGEVPGAAPAKKEEEPAEGA
jgi:N utilization substance protein B